jgi:hypothetical protein
LSRFSATYEEILTVLDCLGLQVGQVRARAGLGVALAPDDLAADRRRNQVVFCSSEPTSSRVGTNIAMPCPDMPRGAFAAMKASA